jgi:hypothetical protein
MSHKLKKECDDAVSSFTFSGRVEADDVDSIQEQINSVKGFRSCAIRYGIFPKRQRSISPWIRFRISPCILLWHPAKIRNFEIASFPRKASHNVLGKTFHTFEKVWGSYESKSFRDIHAAREWGESGKT